MPPYGPVSLACHEAADDLRSEWKVKTMTQQLSNAQTARSQITLFAQPYDITAGGFYFTSACDYEAKAVSATNSYGQRAGVPSDMSEKLKKLERENRELRQANKILRKSSAYFTQAELDRLFKR